MCDTIDFWISTKRASVVKMFKSVDAVVINDEEALIELQKLVEQIDVKEKMLFRANHGSNAYNIAGTFPDEKNAMLKKISWLKEHPENVRPEGFRAF